MPNCQRIQKNPLRRNFVAANGQMVNISAILPGGEQSADSARVEQAPPDVQDLFAFSGVVFESLLRSDSSTERRA